MRNIDSQSTRLATVGRLDLQNIGLTTRRHFVSKPPGSTTLTCLEEFETAEPPSVGQDIGSRIDNKNIYSVSQDASSEDESLPASVIHVRPIFPQDDLEI